MSQSLIILILVRIPCSSIKRPSSLIVAFANPLTLSISIRPTKPPRFYTSVSRSQPPPSPNPQSSDEELVQDLRVPDQWLLPEKAREESDWLKLSLQKWLDEEYCPEPTNLEISKVAAQSYHDSLLAKRTDLGEILLKMAQDLESISFTESFHGPFSSANAALHLILHRIPSDSDRIE